MTTNYTGLTYSKMVRLLRIKPNAFSEPYSLHNVEGKFTSESGKQPQERCFVLHPDGIASSVDEYHRRMKSTLCLVDEANGTEYIAGSHLSVTINGVRAQQRGKLVEGQNMIVGAEDGADGGTGGDAYMEVEFTPSSNASRK